MGLQPYIQHRIEWHPRDQSIRIEALGLSTESVGMSSLTEIGRWSEVLRQASSCTVHDDMIEAASTSISTYSQQLYGCRPGV